MTVRGVTLSLALAAAAVSCSGDEPAAGPTTTGAPTATSTTTTTAPERPASTTTTAFDPASVEGEVEAAYLRSWDVYADAVYHLELDEEALEDVYAGELLEVRSDEISTRIADGRAALVLVDHEYEIEMTGESTALIIDRYVNHQVLIDPATKDPLEQDPNERIVDAFSARLIGGTWVMFDLRRLA